MRTNIFQSYVFYFFIGDHRSLIIKSLLKIKNESEQQKAKRKNPTVKKLCESVELQKTATAAIQKTASSKKDTTSVEKNKAAPFSDVKEKLYNNLEVILSCSNATPIRSHNGFAYVCCFCKDHYVNPADLKIHTSTAHVNKNDMRDFIKKQKIFAIQFRLDITQLKCKICDENIETVEALFDHLRNEHQKIIHADVMKNRIVPFQLGGEELKCAICPLVFTRFKLLMKHMHKHYRNYVCEICGSGFFNHAAMYRHKDTHTTGNFACGECGKVFSSNQKRTSHVNKVHKFMSMASKCGMCNERFTSNRMKDKHMIAVHGMTPIILNCMSCDKTFPDTQLLKTHVKKFHLMEKNYPCTECDKAFFTNRLLKNHMLTHTGVKEFQCDVCTKWFPRKTSLREHIRIHTNDRRFTCLHCGRGFVQKCSWRGHMRSVHGEIVD